MATSKKTAPRKTAGKPKKAAASPSVKKALEAPVAKPNPVRPAPEAKSPAKTKTKLVRDSFTIPKNEYGVLEALKKRALRLACPAKKSEILRAGVAVLNSLSDPAFFAAIDAVPSLKTGRPKKS
jgi:hypothetical protein